MNTKSPASSPASLLDKLIRFFSEPDSGHRLTLWEELGRDELFSALQALVKECAAGQAPSWIDDTAKWTELSEKIFNAESKSVGELALGFDKINTIVEAARRASIYHDLGSADSSEELLPVSTFEDEGLRKEWMSIAYLAFREGISGECSDSLVRVPVAITAPNQENPGCLCRLRLQFFRSAPVGFSANHPSQLLRLNFSESGFLKPMRDAWNVARNSPNAANDVSSAWLLEPWDEGETLPPMRGLGGPSLTAAAFRAWRLALEGKKVDPRLLVMAKVKEDGNGEWTLGEVGEIEEKTMALCNRIKDVHDSRPLDWSKAIEIVGIDRIAIYDPPANPTGNKQEAERVIGEAVGELHKHIDVVDITSHKQRGIAKAD